MDTFEITKDGLKVLLEQYKKENALLKHKLENFESLQRCKCCDCCEDAISKLSEAEFKFMELKEKIKELVS